MTAPKSFHAQTQGIHYCSPAHGGWGVVRTVLLVPEIHLLFVCPVACALAAIEQGIKHRVSYLCIDEVDIVTGDYEDLIAEAATAVLGRLPAPPRALFIFVSCLDDLLATDHRAMLDRLAEKHGIPMRLCRMNPIMLDTDTPPAVSVQRSMYSLLEQRERRKDAVNLMGVFTPLAPECELLSLLSSCGRTVRSLPACEGHGDFLAMGHASLNLVLRPEALFAAKDLRDRLGMEYLFLPVSYRLDSVARHYDALREEVDCDSGMLDAARGRAEAAVARAKNAVAGRDVYLDAGAFCRPFDTARALVEYGFAVKEVFADKLPAYERDALSWLGENAPGVAFSKTEHHATVHKIGARSEGVSLGFNAAYLTGSRSVVPLEYDEGMFGYHAIERLMDMIVDAAGRDADLRAMIHEYGLVV